jgi:hypothetical protein
MLMEAATHFDGLANDPVVHCEWEARYEHATQLAVSRRAGFWKLAK